MDWNKLTPQIRAIGKIYRIVSDACGNGGPSPGMLPDPDMRPMRTYTMAMLRMQQERKSTAEMEAELSGLSEIVNVEDWEDIFNTPIPLELRNEFWLGYYRGGSNTISSIRKAKGMTQGQLAQAVGVTQVDVSRWERGAVTPRIASLRKIADVLECKVDDLIQLRTNC